MNFIIPGLDSLNSEPQLFEVFMCQICVEVEKSVPERRAGFFTFSQFLPVKTKIVFDTT